MPPARLAALGTRRICGRVIASWSGNRLLVQAHDNQNVDVELSQGSGVPSIGTNIEAIGTPATDLRTIRLLQSEWRTAPDVPSVTPAVIRDVVPRSLFVDENGRRRYKSSFHGRLIRLTGIIKAITSTPSSGREAYLEADGFLIRVSADACPAAFAGLAPLAKVSVAGVCILETDIWNPSAAFPQAHGLRLAV